MTPLASYQAAIRLKSDYAEAYFNLATVLQALERFDEAEDAYDEAGGSNQKSTKERSSTVTDTSPERSALRSRNYSMGPIRTAPGVWFRCCRILVAIVLATNLLARDYCDHGRNRQFQARVGKFALQPESKSLPDRGLVLNGTVTDEAGKPIAGAVVRAISAPRHQQGALRENGRRRHLHIARLLASRRTIVVSAKGRATDMKEVTVASDMGPVNFRMKAGGTVQIRVLNEQGEPIPNAASSCSGGVASRGTWNSRM